MKAAPAPVIKDWNELPLICDVSHVALLMGRSARAIEVQVTRGTFQVMPFAVRPMRWKKSDLQAWHDGQSKQQRPRRAS